MEVESFDSVWNAICDSPEEAKDLEARSELLSVLNRQVRSWSVQPRTIAKRLGVTHSRVTAMLQGKLGKFSLDDLVTLTAMAERVPVAEHFLGKGKAKTLYRTCGQSCFARAVMTDHG